MKKIKRIIHRIKARASATQNRIHGGLSATALIGPHESDEAIELVPTSPETSHTYMYSDTLLCYANPFAKSNPKERESLSFGEWQSFEKGFHEDMRRYPPEVIVNRQSPCPLHWLPLDIRAIIWKYVFGYTKEAIFLREDGIAPKIPTSMRFVSLNLMSEAWFAWVNSMSNRTLVVMDLPRHCYLGPPCPILQVLSTVRLRALKFALGDKDAKKAAVRNRRFVRFILKHREHDFLAIRTLIIELRKNWERSDFTEVDLANLLICGAFARIERLRIHGWIRSERLDQLLERVKSMA